MDPPIPETRRTGSLSDELLSSSTESETGFPKKQGHILGIFKLWEEGCRGVVKSIFKCKLDVYLYLTVSPRVESDRIIRVGLVALGWVVGHCRQVELLITYLGLISSP